MPRHDEDQEADDLHDPDPSDMDDDDDDDGVDTHPCPHCGADVYEESQQCLVCGQYIDPFRRSNYPRWVPVAALLVILAMLYAVVHWIF
jgi:hypothetical protein